VFADGVYLTETTPGDGTVAVSGGKAVNLTGQLYVQISDSRNTPDFEVEGGPFSVAYWAKGWPSADSWNCFLSKRGDGGQGWSIRRNGTNANNFRWTTRTANPSDDEEMDLVNHPNGTAGDGGWHHTICTIDTTGMKEIFIDGSSAAVEQGYVPLTDAANSYLLIGARDDDNGPFDRWTQVQMDDVKIYKGRPIRAAEAAVLATGADFSPYPAPGTYTVTYSFTDFAGNPAIQTTRTVIIESAEVVKPVLTLDSVTGSTVSCTLFGAANTTFDIMSSTDIESGFLTTETTDPATVTTDGSGNASFTIDTGGRPKLFIRAEGP
jgi:hypothetical protein